jgi:hypothetical protein
MSGLGVRVEGWNIGSEGVMRKSRERRIREKQDGKKLHAG